MGVQLLGLSVDMMSKPLSHQWCLVVLWALAVPGWIKIAGILRVLEVQLVGAQLGALMLKHTNTHTQENTRTHIRAGRT